MWQTRMYLMRIPHRMGHSKLSDVRSARVCLKPPHPGTHSSWPKREGSRIALSNSDRTTVAESCSVRVSFLSKNNFVGYTSGDLDGG